jgi:uracil-DNA glycosylase
VRLVPAGNCHRCLTNAVKHFKWEKSGKRRLHKPPNRTEIVACRHWLEAELVTVKPVVVVALGTVAGSSLVGPAGILVATLRPSAVLRSADADARERAYAGLVSDLKAAAAAARR